jgi:hypothetical protein
LFNSPDFRFSPVTTEVPIKIKIKQINFIFNLNRNIFKRVSGWTAMSANAQVNEGKSGIFSLQKLDL